MRYVCNTGFMIICDGTFDVWYHEFRIEITGENKINNINIYMSLEIDMM